MRHALLSLLLSAAGTHLLALDAGLGAVRIEAQQDAAGAVIGYRLRGEIWNNGPTIRFRGLGNDVAVPVIEQRAEQGWEAVSYRIAEESLVWTPLHEGEALAFSVPVATANADGTLNWHIRAWPARLHMPLQGPDGRPVTLSSRELADPRISGTAPVSGDFAGRQSTPAGFAHERSPAAAQPAPARPQPAAKPQPPRRPEQKPAPGKPTPRPGKH